MVADSEALKLLISTTDDSRLTPMRRPMRHATKRKGATPYVVGGVIVLLLVLTLVVVWQSFIRSVPSTPNDQLANNTAGSRTGGLISTPHKAGFSIQRRAHQDHIAGTSAAYVVTNVDELPLTISRVVYNGEHEAGLAWWWEIPYPGSADGKKLPVTLTIGESQYFMKYTAWCGGKFNYRKQVVFIDIFTNRGDFRYRDGVLAIKP